MTHEDLTVIAGHPGGHAGRQSVGFHLTAVLAGVSFFPSSLFYQQIEFGICGLGTLELTLEAVAAGGVTIGGLIQGHFSFNRCFIGQAERDTAGKLTLGGIITKIQFGFNNRTAEFTDTSTVLFGIMLTAIYQDGEAFETVFYGL